MMTDHGFPELTPEQMDSASSSTLHSLNLLKDIFDRIEELLNEEKEKEMENENKKENEKANEKEKIDTTGGTVG